MTANRTPSRNWPHLALIATAYALLLALAIWSRATTYERWLPVFDHVDESYRFIHAYQIRDDAPLGDSYGQIEWAQGFPPMQPWVAIGVQRWVESRVAFPFPPDYVRALRALSAALNALTALVIAATAWRVARPLGTNGAAVAGWLAGIGWAVLPRVVGTGNHALIDPLIFPSVAAALLLAVDSIQSDRATSALGSLLAVIVGIYLKYLVVYALWLPLAAVVVLILRRWGRVWPWLLVMAIISAATAGYLVFGHGALSLDNREADIFYESGVGNMFSLARNAENLRYTLAESLGVTLFTAGVLIAGAAYALRRRAGLQSPALMWLALLLPYMLADLMLSSSVDVLSTWEPNWYRVRYTLPMALGLMVIWGVGVATAADTLRRWRGRVGQTLAALTVTGAALLIVAPSVVTLRAQAAIGSQPHTMETVWRYTDASLNADAGTMLVSGGSFLQKTWNRPWSGYNGAQTFRWEFSDAPESKSAAQWQADGFAYFGLTDYDREHIFTGDGFEAWLDTLYPLKTVQPTGGSDAISTFYAFHTPDVQPDSIVFGDSVALVGYDISTDTLAHGEALTLRPYWRALDETPAANLSFFVHLLPPDSNIPAAQFDGPPTRITRPTLTWDDPAETLIGTSAVITVPDNLTAGEYRLALGLYDFSTGVRLQLDADNAFYAIPLTVTE